MGPTCHWNRGSKRGRSPALPRTRARAVATARLGGGAAPRPTAAAGQRRGLAGPWSGRPSGARAPAGRRRGERAGGPRRRQGQGRWRLAAARGGRAVPAMAKQGASGRGRRNDEGCSATSGRSAATSRPTQGWRAACAGGATGLPRQRGGAPAPAVRDSSGDRVGKGEESAEKLTGDSI